LWIHKKRFEACVRQLAARSIGVMQQAALAACIVSKYLHATKQHFACCPRGRHAIRRIERVACGPLVSIKKLNKNK
jgi:hypothetical protein